MNVPKLNAACPKLANDDGYRVAAEAYRLATDLGASDSMLEALFLLMQREAKRVEGGQ